MKRLQKNNLIHSKSCLVLDLDETLVHFFGSKEDWKYMKNYDNNQVKSRILDITVEDDFMWGIARPHYDKFLKEIFDIFDIVGVWSAGTEDYVQAIVKLIFPHKKPYFVWSRSKCETMITHNDTIRQKPLAKLLEMYKEIDPDRIIIIDDRTEVCEQDTLHHIDIPTWDATFEDIDRTDTALLSLLTFMKQKLSKAKNFKLVSNKNIF